MLEFRHLRISGIPLTLGVRTRGWIQFYPTNFFLKLYLPIYSLANFHHNTQELVNFVEVNEECTVLSQRKSGWEQNEPNRVTHSYLGMLMPLAAQLCFNYWGHRPSSEKKNAQNLEYRK